MQSGTGALEGKDTVSADVPGLRESGLFCQCGHCFGAYPSGRCRQFPLALLARQAAGSALIFLRADAAALVWAASDSWWPGTSRVTRWDGCCWALG